MGKDIAVSLEISWEIRVRAGGGADIAIGNNRSIETGETCELRCRRKGIGLGKWCQAEVMIEVEK